MSPTAEETWQAARLGWTILRTKLDGVQRAQWVNIIAMLDVHFETGAALAPTAKPLPPEVLADALQDRVQPASGRLLAARPVAPQPELPPGRPCDTCGGDGEVNTSLVGIVMRPCRDCVKPAVGRSACRECGESAFVAGGLHNGLCRDCRGGG